jgi:hypothetical protein
MKLPPLTKAQVRELKRRVKQIEDPRRWVVYSPLPGGLRSRGFYYLVDLHGYTMDAKEATLFKRREIAVAVGDALDTLRRKQGREPHKIKMVRV